MMRKTKAKAGRKSPKTGRKATKSVKSKVSKLKAGQKTNIPAKRISSRTKPIKRKSKVNALPKGYAAITPYLIVDNGHEAIKFYQAVFSAKLIMQMQTPAQKIGHAELKIGDSKFMLADECSERQIYGPNKYQGTPVTIHLYVSQVDKIVERAIQNGAKLVRPIENMFYGDRSGMILDPFGHSWCISTHIEDVSPAKLKKRKDEFYQNQ